MSRLKEISTFYREFRGSFQTTGAVLPSSRFLAEAIVRQCRKAARPARFLEAGPGTGAFTGALVRLLQPGDELVLVEINPQFVAMLEQRMTDDASWAAVRAQVRVINAPVQEFAGGGFDAVVCGLPFNNFSPSLVHEIMSSLFGRLKPGGWLSFFEYLAIRRLKAPFVGAAERSRLAAVAAVLREFLESYEQRAERVALNVPPAVVHHLQRPTAI